MPLLSAPFFLIGLFHSKGNAFTPSDQVFPLFPLLEKNACLGGGEVKQIYKKEKKVPKSIWSTGEVVGCEKGSRMAGDVGRAVAPETGQET